MRRLALARQGLLGRAPFGRGRPGTLRAIERLGYVQIDTISVVCRAHDHTLQVRVPGYGPDTLQALQDRGEVFEYWAHAAAYLPMRDFRFALPRMAAMRRGEAGWIRSRDAEAMRRVLERVRAEGPLRARDFEAPPGKKSGGWWDHKPAKRALEQLFMQGDLMAIGRDGFQKVYELTERALPAEVDTRAPSVEEYAAHLIARQLDAMGFASTRVCVHLRRTPGLRAAVDEGLKAAAADGALTALEVSDRDGAAEVVYADPELLERRLPPAPARARVLSPFDNVVIHRHRGQALFDFDYRLECYVPAPKRQFGYFCLPLLYRDRLVGRADCKAHRAEGRFEVKALFVEHPEAMDDAAPDALADALRELAAHDGCAEVVVTRTEPRRFRAPLTRALAQSS